MKVLFIIHDLRTGGTQRQLIYLMRGLLEREVTLSLLVFNPVGEFMDEIPDKVKVYYPKFPKPKKAIKAIKRDMENIRSNTSHT